MRSPIRVCRYRLSVLVVVMLTFPPTMLARTIGVGIGASPMFANYTNSTPITITDCPSPCPASGQAASLYPSTIVVAGEVGVFRHHDRARLPGSHEDLWVGRALQVQITDGHAVEAAGNAHPCGQGRRQLIVEPDRHAATMG